MFKEKISKQRPCNRNYKGCYSILRDEFVSRIHGEG